MILDYPADWFLVPEAIERAKSSYQAIKQYADSNGVEDLNIPSLATELLKEVYSVPLFSEKFCEILLNKVKKSGFEPNPEEDELRQIPEVVLQEKHPQMANSILYAALSGLNPVFLSLWGRPCHSGGVQVCNYNLRDKSQGAWHHDESADITVVVPLNTGEYKGGGTEFYKRGIVEPLPTGHALIFPSFTHLHRGLPVESGDRYLLVFWLNGAHK